jgi:hypothetical protein
MTLPPGQPFVAGQVQKCHIINGLQPLCGMKLGDQPPLCAASIRFADTQNERNANGFRKIAKKIQAYLGSLVA